MIGVQTALAFDCDFDDVAPFDETSEYLSQQIITYIGNKRSLLPLIEFGVELVKKDLGKDKLSFLDLFSGTGIVSRLFKKHASMIYANDLESYSYVNNQCFLSNRSPDLLRETAFYKIKLDSLIEENWCTDGFISEMYSPNDDNHIVQGERVFYTRRNAEYLDTARQQLEAIPEEYRTLLMGPLLSEASIHTNTSGVFKGFYKDRNGVGCFGGAGKNALARIMSPIAIKEPILSLFQCPFEVTQLDAYDAVRCLPEVDVAYLDPPYNQHPYGSNYFMLNLLVNYQRPVSFSRVSGIPTDWNRSPYNKAKQAKSELFKVIDSCRASFILLSYNSEGFISYPEMVEFLGQLGDLQVLETKYNTFRGSRNLRNRDIHVKEYLFLLKKGDKNVS